MPLRVTIELIPHGHEFESQVIASAEIENVGGDHHKGRYGVAMYGTAPMQGTIAERVRCRGVQVYGGEVLEFPRTRAGAWALLKVILGQWNP